MKQIYTKKLNSISETEKQVWMNDEIFHLKHKIISKIYADGADIMEEIKSTNFFKSLPINFQNPKISKGENYFTLPWVMVDFPCVFSNEQIFAFRIFYHWGKEINCFLILKGEFQNIFIERLKSNYCNSGFNNVLIYSGDNIWQHHIDDSYRPLHSISSDAELSNKPFLKFAIKFNAAEIDNNISLCLSAWNCYAKLLSS
ncbi:MAG: hypothetical protein RL065_1446 [Bacteroidota bacterium]|jgi:hypothetical protein